MNFCTLGTTGLSEGPLQHGGRPDFLFHLPSSSGFQNVGILVKKEDIRAAENVLGINKIPISKHLHVYMLR